MKILVGVDGSPRQPDALRLAIGLAAVDDGRVVAATTCPDAGAILDIADEQLRDVPHDLRAMPGQAPAEALHALARAEHADVLVIGSAHRGRVGRTLLGTTGDRVVHGAPCPVAVAPHGYHEAQHTFGRIGVAFDGDAESRAALEWAKRLALAAGAQIVVLTVADPIGFAIDPAVDALAHDDVIVSLRTSRQRDLDEAVSHMPAEVRPRGELLEGAVGPSLVAASADLDLLVTGSHDHGPIGHVLLGGVSRKLMLECHSPVVVIPRSSLREAMTTNRVTFRPAKSAD